jgi:predicted N-formylglutamate amidohydrolase
MGNSVTALLRGVCLPDRPFCVIVTCEHGGHRFPKKFSGLFKKIGRLLHSHRGYDQGALTLAKKLSRELKAPFYFSTCTRLLIDLNRSPHNPKRFSEITNRLSAPDKKVLQKTYYLPYREEVESAVMKHVRRGEQVLHLSVHTFTPVLHGEIRNADVGFLYDPSRKAEAAFCRSLQRVFGELDPGLRTRRNYPYRGTADSFTSHLRKRFPEESYLGIELEVNQQALSSCSNSRHDVQQTMVKSLRMTTFREEHAGNDLLSSGKGANSNR